MLSSALRSTVGSVRTIVSRGVIRQPHSSKARAFSVLSPRFGELSSNFFGPGAKPGTVADDIDQATGIERAELLSKLEGKDIYDLSPLKITAVGTKKDPVMVKSVDPVRFVGCTGFPVDSHETVWLVKTKVMGTIRYICTFLDSKYQNEYHISNITREI
ncbi:unnamed protein product [Rhizophagus irregularis]|uniref:Cytochrome c oxidase subunit IV n=2 Tax=Rhizophagus irregularis TaxID=588596 RepID=A0A915YS54_9GLOM|nr:cytochrome c oxidase subunit IV [Rhizophagus irregularis DAOM 197198w]CAB4388613.1 unnamed protein product [Rhizophagus irregularis]GBC32986.1 cytochrome c oxidase subunit 5b [Rhizophagus irregularis DAOM 181602=DAOM 197198]CAB4478019.1 unnamed protein product [Rhizophagus irregularis]CAB5326215.1 unnamed protein product [Rhizophagus irregularis]